ncbi:TM2 domain-containing protein, partial [Paracoccus rhizosphaerae]
VGLPVRRAVAYSLRVAHAYTLTLPASPRESRGRLEFCNNALDTQQQILIEQRVTNDGKSAVIAYLLLVFLGAFGAHRFYLGKTGTGVAMLLLWIVGLLTLVLGVGLIALAAVGIWAFVDLFLIPGMIREDQERLRARLAFDMNLRPAPAIPA